MVLYNALLNIPLTNSNLFTGWAIKYYSDFLIYVLTPLSDKVSATTDLEVNPSAALSVAKYAAKFGMFSDIYI